MTQQSVLHLVVNWEVFTINMVGYRGLGLFVNYYVVFCLIGRNVDVEQNSSSKISVVYSYNSVWL